MCGCNTPGFHLLSKVLLQYKSTKMHKSRTSGEDTLKSKALRHPGTARQIPTPFARHVVPLGNTKRAGLLRFSNRESSQTFAFRRWYGGYMPDRLESACCEVGALGKVGTSAGFVRHRRKKALAESSVSFYPPCRPQLQAAVQERGC